LAIGALDGSISIFSISHGSIVSNFSNGHKNAVTGINFDLNRSQLFSCDVDGSVCQWDLKNGSMVASWKAPSSSSLSDICIFGDLLIGGSFSMFVWNLKDKSLKQVKTTYYASITMPVACLSSTLENRNSVT
jgi:WD40 repeat protein